MRRALMPACLVLEWPPRLPNFSSRGSGPQDGGREWGLPRGREGDEEGVAAHDRGRDEPALLRPVDHVDEDSRGLGLVPAEAVDLLVLARIDHEPGAHEGTLPVLAR